MTSPKAEDVRRGISVIWETLQCPICLELMSTPVSTKCDHKFCKFCMMKLLDGSRRKEANCPVCKTKITKRSLQESPGFQRLVEGLQNMVQAYENDTCTNYFSGRSQKRRQTSVGETEQKKRLCSGGDVSSEDVSGPDLVNDKDEGHIDLPMSHSSTVAAKDAFAKLMGIEDSCPFISDNEGFDSGLGDAPPTSEKETDNCKANTSTKERQEPQVETAISEVLGKATSPPRTRRIKKTTRSNDPLGHLVLSPEEEQNKPVRRSSRNNKRKALSPDKIFHQRQKKSLEKVSEWLMGISPTEDNSEKEKNMECSHDSDDTVSVAGSCTSSTPLEGNHTNKFGSPKRAQCGKALEVQIFGAIYRRERRGNRSFSPQNRRVLEAPAPCPPEELQIQKKIPKRRMSNTLTPADFVKTLRSEDIDDCAADHPVMRTQEKDSSNYILKETEEHTFIDLTEELDSSSEKHGVELPEEDHKESRHVEDSPVFDVSLRQPGRKSRKKMHGTWQDVDGSLQAQDKANSENNKKKKASKKKSENSKAGKRKPAKVPHPLVLVGAIESECNTTEIPKSRPKSGETDAQIETYPSSEEPETPVIRRSRRSRRLQLFTEEVQGSHKKACTAKATKYTIPGSDDNKVQQTEEAKANTDMNNTSYSPNRKTETSTKRNGCVYDEDMGGIENMEFSDDKPGAQNTIEKTIAEIPDAGNPLEANVACSVAMVSSSRSPPAAFVPCAVLESINQSNPLINPRDDFGLNAPQETSASQEDDKNDSEVDTEQLLKSFKGTKRKSFHLGSPTIKRHYFRSDKENIDGTKSQENVHVGTDMEAEKDQEFSKTEEYSIVHQETDKRTELENSCSSDLIPPSKSPNHILQDTTQRNHRRLRRSIVTRPTQEVVESSNPDGSGETQERVLGRLSGISVSSALSPNKVAKSQMESLHSSVNLQAVDSGLLFPAFGISQEDLACSLPIAPNQLRCPDNQLPYELASTMRKTPKELTSSHSVRTEAAVDPDKGCTENCIGNVANSESSLTPDGLLPPIVQMVASHEVESGKGSGEVSAHSMSSLKQRKKRRAQRLQSSSESDCSDEEDELPPLAHIFRPPACPPAVEEESACLLEDHDQDQGSSREAGGCEGAFTAAREAGQEGSPPVSPSPEWANTSQASVDLFSTPEECAVGDTGLSMESSQFSNDIITTQQKVAMHEELRRLERMMALVSEALHEKEGGHGANSDSGAQDAPLLPQPGGPSGHNLHRTSPCGQGTSVSSAKEGAPDRGRDVASLAPGLGDCGSLGPTQPHLNKHEETPGMVFSAGQCCRQSGRSLRGSGATEIPTKVGSGVKAGDKSQKRTSSPLSARQEAKETGRDIHPANTHLIHTPQRDSAGMKLVLVSSGLSSAEQSMVKKFAKRAGGSVCSQVTSETTHIIMSTDGQLVCERTLKYFLGIAGRKWVVSFQWISECFRQGKVLNEMAFEVQGDVVNGHSHQGPLRARTTKDSSLLMKGYEICFQGPFTDMTTGQMEWMVELCGATVVKDPLLFTGKQKSHQLVVTQPGSDQSQTDYQALQRRATLVTRGWLLDTVATYTLQSPDNYIT